MDKARLDFLRKSSLIWHGLTSQEAKEVMDALEEAWEQLAVKDAEIERLRTQLGDWGEELAVRDVT